MDLLLHSLFMISKSNKKGCKTKKCKYLVEFENEILDKVNKKTQNIKKITNNS